MSKWKRLLIFFICAAALWLVSTGIAQANEAYNEVNPKWSPDGKMIAFERISISGRGWQGIYWINIFTNSPLPRPIAIPEPSSGSSRPGLLQLPDFEQYRLSPQSKKLYFQAKEFCWAKNRGAIAQQGYRFVFTQTPSLFVGVINPQSGKEVEPAPFVTGETAQGIAENRYADWSIDDNIVFVSGEGDAINLYIKSYDNSYLEDEGDATKSNAVKVTDIGSDGVFSDPKWSPDGNEIVFSLYKQGNTDIYLLKDVKNYLEKKAIEPNTPMPKAEQLTHLPTEELNPVWSTDGRMIAFYSLVTTAKEDEKAKRYDLWVMNANGDGQKKVADRVSPQDSGPTWLPEQFGKKIIYVNAARDSLWVVDVTSSVQTKIPDSPLFSIGLKFQSDLDNKKISEKLWQEFKKKKIKLPNEKSPIAIEKQGSRWLITGGNQTYCIRKEEGKLNIYPYSKGYEYGYITGIDCISHPRANKDKRKKELLLITYSALDEYGRQKIYWEEINRQWWE